MDTAAFPPPQSVDEVAQLVAAHADPDVRLVAGGRVKHMSRSMNDVLATSFGDVGASLARKKSGSCTPAPRGATSSGAGRAGNVTRTSA